MPSRPRYRIERIVAGSPTDGLLGLVRMLDPSASRHFYAVGDLPPGEVVGELGSLHSSGGPGREAAGLTADNRLVTDAYAPVARPRLRTTGRWVVAPLAWRGFSSRAHRMRATAWRAARLVRTRRDRPHSAGIRAAGHAGWLDREPGPRSVPLFSSVHPVTGDQLLTNEPSEATDLGYVGVELLGYVDSTAPLTGRRQTTRPELPWASRFGRRADDGAVVQEARGGITDPGPDPLPAPFAVTGWALVPRTSVAVVEILVDGRPAGRARLGLERPDVVRETTHVDAPICGFEMIVTAGHLPAGADRVGIGAVAHDLDGRGFPLGEVTFRIAEPPAALEEGRGHDLRERARRVCGATAPARTAAARGTNALVVTHRLDRGGAQLWLLELLERLAARPATTATVVSGTDGPLRDELEALGIPVHVAGPHPVGTVDDYEGRLAQLAAWAAPQGFNVAVVNALRSLPAVEVADLLGIPSVAALHESYDLDTWWLVGYGPGGVDPYVKQRARDALGRVTAAVFEAEATRRLYMPHADPDRLITLPYAIELDEIDRFRDGFDRAAARRRLGLDPVAPLVVCLGSIEPRKAQTSLAQAFGQIADRHPTAVLALVGETSFPHAAPHNAALRDHVERAGLSGRIRIVPMSTNPYEWHAVADVLVSPSDIESLPRVALEAMAFEVPVVATRIFGLTDLIDDGRTGWLCEPRDIGALAAALHRSLDAGPERRAELGREARQVVRAHHDAGVYATRFGALLDGLVSDPGAEPRALLQLD